MNRLIVALALSLVMPACGGSVEADPSGWECRIEDGATVPDYWQGTRYEWVCTCTNHDAKPEMSAAWDASRGDCVPPPDPAE